MKILCVFLVLVALHCGAYAQVSNMELHDELLAMVKVDQDERGKCISVDGDLQMKCLARIAQTVDLPHTGRLEKIFDTYGFPDKKLVGSDGLNAFMILLQHATSDKLRLRSVTPIKKAFKRKELSPMDYANFIDRLRLHMGKSQLYGTGFEFKDGKMVLSKTQDLRNLEKRRRNIGLPPMSEAVKMMKEIYKLDVVMPQTK